MSNGGGLPGMPAIPGMPGGRGGATKKQRKSGKKNRRKFGNPAKQKQWEAQQTVKDEPSAPTAGSAFGLAASQPAAPAPTLDDLPDDLKRMLGQR